LEKIVGEGVSSIHAEVGYLSLRLKLPLKEGNKCTSYEIPGAVKKRVVYRMESHSYKWQTK
jgi:hypothetical protein